MNIFSVFEQHFPGDLAALFLETPDGQTFSYRDLLELSGRMANYLQSLGVKAGDRVAVQVKKSPEVLILYLATLRLGAIYLPLNTAYTDNELAYFLGDARPVLLVCEPEKVATAAVLCQDHNIAHCLDLGDCRDGSLWSGAVQSGSAFTTVDVKNNDIAVILYTSGTTGRPKGAMICHGNLAANALALRNYWQWRQEDVLLHSLPVFHIHGLFVACHSVLLGGSKMIFLKQFDVDTVLANLPRSTVMMGVPTYYVRLLADKRLDREVCRNMRLFISGSAPLLEQTFKEFEERTGHKILERYGMTETGMNISNPVDGDRLPDTVGLPLPGVNVRIVDDTDREVADNEIGNLLVKGDNVFHGYWQQPEKTRQEFTEDGFFRTGDLARRHDNGYISIVGRNRDMIITGGLNVYPREVELELDQLPGVVESAVIGVPHADFGEAVTAIIVREKTASLNEKDVQAYLKNRLANFKLPKHIHFLDALPRNTMGKVQKNLLREKFAG